MSHSHPHPAGSSQHMHTLARGAPGVRAMLVQLARAEAKVRKALDAYDALRDTPPADKTDAELASLREASQEELDLALERLARRTDALERLTLG
jgi:hypothetical protein